MCVVVCVVCDDGVGWFCVDLCVDVVGGVFCCVVVYCCVDGDEVVVVFVVVVGGVGGVWEWGGGVSVGW